MGCTISVYIWKYSDGTYQAVKEKNRTRPSESEENRIGMGKGVSF